MNFQCFRDFKLVLKPKIIPFPQVVYMQSLYLEQLVYQDFYGFILISRWQMFGVLRQCISFINGACRFSEIMAHILQKTSCIQTFRNSQFLSMPLKLNLLPKLQNSVKKVNPCEQSYDKPPKDF